MPPGPQGGASGFPGMAAPASLYDNDGLLSNDRYITQANQATRLGFIKKVYSLVFVQLCITVVIASPFVYLPQSWAQDHVWLLWTSMALTLVMACLGGSRAFRTFPGNYIMLFGFTVFEAIVVGFVVNCYAAPSVLCAFVLTIGIVCLLTLYALSTKKDFTVMGSTLVVLCGGLLMFGLLLMFFPAVPFLHKIYSAMGGVLFGFFLIYDTQMIMSGRHKHRYQIDDFCFAALNIYLDILNIFLNLLELMGDRK